MDAPTTKKPKRDLFEGAVPAVEYYKSPSTKPKLSNYTNSTLGYRIKVAPEDARKVKEKVIQAEIIDYVRRRGGWCYKAKAVNLVGDGVLAPTDKGVPDLIACYKGLFVAIEVKAAVNGKKVSGEQVAQIAKIRDAGGIAEVCWTTRQVARILDGIDNLISVA
jgi:hypothetical protein